MRKRRVFVIQVAENDFIHHKSEAVYSEHKVNDEIKEEEM